MWCVYFVALIIVAVLRIYEANAVLTCWSVSVISSKVRKEEVTARAATALLTKRGSDCSVAAGHLIKK